MFAVLVSICSGSDDLDNPGVSDYYFPGEAGHIYTKLSGCDSDTVRVFNFEGSNFCG